MQRLFGTDGIRDEATSKIFTSKSLSTLSRAIAHFVQLRNPDRRSSILIGLDGRLSGVNIQDHFVHWLLLNNIKIAFCEYENTATDNSDLAVKAIAFVHIVVPILSSGAIICTKKPL